MCVCVRTSVLIPEIQGARLFEPAADDTHNWEERWRRRRRFEEKLKSAEAEEGGEAGTSDKKLQVHCWV